ncbi:MAG: tRNA (adenosine(37)-N6)-dimethylallyltransferase MiaA, partial [Candidatus Staskawiczbacteria bacterium]|nr:tRNA (adenosine(37)-N6)-dimethylallyltransferase MiaA [Candidatus Staskawiczbacteria bacterium]
SRQVYKGMDIGTAKPLDLEGVPHWMLDIKNPNQLYSVGEYKKDAIKIIHQILKRKKLPILVGGTGLYIKAVAENLDIPKVEANPLLRTKIEREIQKNGLDFVFKKLIKLDPEAAYIVDPKNPRRVIRALEITLLTKKPFSRQRKMGSPLFDVLEIGVSMPEKKLRDRINQRVGQMVKNGLVEEVKELIKKYGADQQAFDAIGYREIIEYLNPEKNGAGNKTTLEQALENIKINTWHYAKRQMTWFKKDKKIHWIDNQKDASRLIDTFLKR